MIDLSTSKAGDTAETRGHGIATLVAFYKQYGSGTHRRRQWLWSTEKYEWATFRDGTHREEGETPFDILRVIPVEA